MGKVKLGAEGKEGLRGERLSLVHRYMTDAAANPVPGPQPPDVPTTPSEPDESPLPAKAIALPSEPESTPAISEPPAKAEEPSAQPLQEGRPSDSQLLHEPRLPIYEWSHVDAATGESQHEVDWAHELLRMREERDHAAETPS